MKPYVEGITVGLCSAGVMLTYWGAIHQSITMLLNATIIFVICIFGLLESVINEEKEIK